MNREPSRSISIRNFFIRTSADPLDEWTKTLSGIGWMIRESERNFVVFRLGYLLSMTTLNYILRRPAFFRGYFCLSWTKTVDSGTHDQYNNLRKVSIKVNLNSPHNLSCRIFLPAPVSDAEEDEVPPTQGARFINQSLSSR